MNFSPVGGISSQSYQFFERPSAIKGAAQWPEAAEPPVKPAQRATMETNSAAVMVFVGRKVPSPKPLIRPLPDSSSTLAAYQLPGFTSVKRAGAAPAGMTASITSVSDMMAASILVIRLVMAGILLRLVYSI